MTSKETPLYTCRRDEQGLWILHSDLACVSLVRFDEPDLATPEQREHGRPCMLCEQGMTSTGHSKARHDGLTAMERFSRQRQNKAES
jgi:hypothetical protein